MKLLQILLLFFLLPQYGCIVKNSNHSDFWQVFFNARDQFRQNYKNNHQFELLFNSLKPENEDKMYNNLKRLFIAGSAKKNGQSISTEIHNREKITSQEYYHTVVYYEKSNYNEQSTYKVNRNTTFRNISAYTVYDFFYFFEKLSNIAIFPAKADSLYSNSSTYNFLCTYHNCKEQFSQNTMKISFQLNQKMKQMDPVFYDRMTRFYQYAKFHTKVYAYPNKILLFEITTNSNEITFQFYPQTQKLDYSKIKRIRFVSNIHVNYKGLKIQVTGLNYSLDIQSNSKEIVLTGRFTNIPKYQISGRLFSIIPTNVIDAFIPGDMDSYVRDYFYLLVKGKDNKGTKFVNKTLLKKNNKMDMSYMSEYEIFQKPFRWMGSASSTASSKSDNSPFLRKLENTIVEDLR